MIATGKRPAMLEPFALRAASAACRCPARCAAEGSPGRAPDAGQRSASGRHHRLRQHRHRPDDQGRAQPAARARRGGRHRPRVRRPAQGAASTAMRSPTTGLAGPAHRRSARSTWPSTRRRPTRTPSTPRCWPSAASAAVDLTPAALGPAVVPAGQPRRRTPSAARRQPDHLRRPGDRPHRRGDLAAWPTLTYAEIGLDDLVARRPAPARARTSTSSRTSTARGARDRRRREARQGDHHPEPGRPADHDAQHDLRGAAGRRRPAALAAAVERRRRGGRRVRARATA